MERKILEYANLGDKIAVGSLEDLLASIAWMADNEGHGIKEAGKKTIDKARALVASMMSAQAAKREGRVPLTFDLLRTTSVPRAQRWHHGDLGNWNVAEWSNAMAGEAGEACNATKKLRRIEERMQQGDGDSAAPKTLEEARAKVAKEIGDTIIYADLVCERVGWTTEDAVRLAFNQISEREGFPERL
jgi:NTP pyrophosphatase (non-canonical NTP hydrolase)